jgi:hypothetical protein
MIIQANLVCPHCQAKETIALDSSCSLQFHHCHYCREPYGVSKNDCCILCSYSDVSCSQVDQNLAL